MLSDEDLREIAEKLKLPLRAVVCKDELPENRKVGSYYINLQNEEDGNGTHWVFARIFPDRTACYVDSFGIIAPLEVEYFLKPFSPFPYNTRQIQDIKSEHCGLFCIAADAFFTYDANPKLSTADNLEHYCSMYSTDTKKNDKILKEYLKK